MAEKPLIENLKDKLKVSKKSDEENTEGNAEEGNVSDVLERFRIPLSIDIPDPVLTSKEAQSVRFGYTKPHGFSTTQVEKFHGEVLQSLKWYVKSLEQRDKHIHKLATEIDKCLTDLQNTRFQLETFQGLGMQAMVDDKGNYITEDDLTEEQLLIVQKDSRIIELENELNLMNKDYEHVVEDNKRLHQQVQESSVGLPSAPPSRNNDAPSNLSDEEVEELRVFRENAPALDEWEKAVTEEYERIENELENLKETLATGGNVNTELLNSKENEIAELRDALQEYVDALNESNAALSASTSELEDAKQRLENSKIVVAELNQKITDAEDDAMTLMVEVQKMEALKAEITELQDRLSKTESEYVEAAEVANEIDAELTKVKQDLSLTEKNIVSLNEEKTALESQLSEAESQLVEAVETANAIEIERQRLEALANVESSNGNVKQFQDKIVALENHINDLEDYAKELEGIIEDGQSATSGSDDASTIKEYEDRLVSYQAQIKSLTNEVENLREQVDEDEGVYIEGYKRIPGIRPEDLGL